MIKKLLLVLCAILLVSCICFSETGTLTSDMAFDCEMYTVTELDDIFGEIVVTHYHSTGRLAALITIPILLSFIRLKNSGSPRFRFTHGDCLMCKPGRPAQLYAKVECSAGMPRDGEIYELRDENGNVLSEQFYSPERCERAFTFDIPSDASGTQLLSVYRRKGAKPLSCPIAVVVNT